MFFIGCRCDDYEETCVTNIAHKWHTGHCLFLAILFRCNKKVVRVTLYYMLLIMLPAVKSRQCRHALLSTDTRDGLVGTRARVLLSHRVTVSIASLACARRCHFHCSELCFWNMNVQFDVTFFSCAARRELVHKSFVMAAKGNSINSPMPRNSEYSPSSRNHHATQLWRPYINVGLLFAININCGQVIFNTTEMEMYVLLQLQV